MREREIRVLPDEVINQIAAGEVVERPASVVKELVENSLDAGARHITIDIEDGGKSLIRVVDDGCGMDRAELHVALRRHATSKLRSVADLFGLPTLGFRGEALPSIASVSRLVIASRRREGDDPAAWELTLEGNRVVSEREVGAAPGTRIEVRDLLYNVPARQKFMKADATETSHVDDCVGRLALANPGVQFRLRHGTRTALDAPRASGALERTVSVLGRRGGELVSSEASGGDVSVRAFLAAPSRAQKTARAVQLFVGRRPVRDRGLLHALLAGYGEHLGKGRYPVAVVFVDVADDAVDVNVHPQKMEVRFADPQSVYAVVKGAVERGVAGAGWETSAPPLSLAPALTGSGRLSRAAERLAGYAASRRVFAPARQEPMSRVSRARQPIASTTPSYASLRYLGQLDGSYLLCEGDGALVLIDQHVASERVELEHLRRAAPTPVQPLLFPEVIADADARALSGAHESLSALGFHLVGTQVAGIPVGTTTEDALRLLRQISTRCDRSANVSELVLGTIACDRAIAAGEPIEPHQAHALLDALDDTPATTSRRHDKPTSIRLTVEELARRFR